MKKALLFIFLLFAGTTRLCAQITTVGATQSSSNNGSTQWSVTFTPAAGDTLLVGCNFNTGLSFAGVADSAGDAFSQIGTEADSSTTAARDYIASNIRGGTTTVSCATATPAAANDIYVTELRGVDPVHPVDTSVSTSGTRNPARASLATSHANELAWAYVAAGHASDPSGWTALSTFNGNLVADHLQTSPGTVSPSVSVTTSWAFILVTLSPAATISVAVSPTSQSVMIGQSAAFTATLQNDTQNQGVTWALSGSGCSGATCGTLTNVTTTSVTYNAPATAPSSTVTLRATSVANASKSASATITVTAPVISVAVSPTSASVPASQSTGFTATLQNDMQNQGVTWSLSGRNCSGASCGTLTNVTTTSVTYNAPATAPSSTVTLRATSVANAAKSASATITVTTPPVISVAVSPTSASVQVSQSTGFTATLQNDTQNQGATWSLSGSSCSGATCGTLTNVTTTSVTYNAPATAPSSTVTLRATSVANAAKSASATITVTTPPVISVLVSPTSASVPISQSSNFTATLQNDTQNQGVTWSLSGSSCSGATCGTLTNATTTSVTYNAPATAPSSTVTLTATSVANAAKSASATITVTAPAISVSVSPTSASLQTSQSTGFTATLQNDTQSQGVTWSLSGSSCSGATCGTLTNATTTSVTYNAPATAPSSSVTLRATSVANASKSASATITVTTPPVISVAVSPTSSSVPVSQSTGFTATLQNDTQNQGVTWSISGSGCSGATCGTLTNVTTTSVTYTAPATAPSPATVTLTATSVANTAKSASATITVTTPVISVAVSPTTASVQISQSSNFTATLQNDTQNQGVTWSLSGTGCSGATCGTLTNVNSTSVTYTAPATAPSPATVTLTATSVANAAKSTSAKITVTTPVISVAVSPTTASVQISQSTGFTATLQNDTQNQGVTWSLSGSGCSGATCGTLTNVTTTSVTYNAPATAPSSTVTLKAKSVANTTKSASATITITTPPISVTVNPASAAIQVSQSSGFTATLQNDTQTKGVTWSLSGSGCSGAACGTLTSVTTTSVTYLAPASVPNPANVTLTATSIADATKSNSATITVIPPPIAVAVTPSSTVIQISTSSGFTATVQNDAQNKGVMWTLSGAGCSGATCGTLTNVSANSATYNAPASVPSPASVTLMATSVTDGTKSAFATITISATPPPPPISVSVSPTSTPVQTSQSAYFTATLQNDTQNQGVTWALSGTGCSGATCGTLTNVTTSSVTYNAPASIPNPATVALTATSVADTTKSASGAITVVSPPPTDPSNLIGVANGSSQVDLTWTASTGGPGLSYLIEQCAGTGCSTFAQVGTSPSASYSNTGLTPSTSYSYRVRATDSSNNLSQYSNIFTITTNAASAAGNVPTLVWSKSSANTTGVAMSSYTTNLPTSGTLNGNVLLATFQYGTDSKVTATVKDDRGDTLTLLETNSDGNQTVSTYCVIPTPGTRVLTMTFTGGMPGYVSMINASEWYNLTCNLDGTSGNSDVNSFTGTVTAGSISTTTDGDLIYQAAEEDGGTGTEKWTQGASPWTFLSASVGLPNANLPQAAQYQVQTTHGAINPTLQISIPDYWNSLAVALQSANSGTIPPAGMRIVHLQEESIPEGQPTPFTLQFPSSGNLLITASNDGPDFDIAGITDSNSNTHTQIGAALNDGYTSGDVQTFYAANAVTSSTMTLTYSMVGPPNGGSTFFLYDVTGASSTPFDSVAGRQSATGSQTSPVGTVAGPSITPSTPNGLVITQIAVNSNSIVNASPGYFAGTIPNPLGQTDPTNENNGWGFDLNTTATPRQYIWTTQGGAVYGWISTAVAFMAPQQ